MDAPYIHETRKLARALQLATQLANPEREVAIREALPLLEGVSLCAAQVILGNREVKLPPLPHETPVQRLLERMARIWLGWVTLKHHDPTWRSQARQGILHAVEEAKAGRKELIHALVLQIAAEAIKALLVDDLDRAQQVFEHALEMGAQHGVDFQLDLAWVKAATLIVANSPSA